MGNIEEGGAQKVAQKNKNGVDQEESGFCNAHGFAVGRGIYREADDGDHNLAQANAPAC